MLSKLDTSRAGSRRFGCPCFIWEPSGYESMGLIDRSKVEWSHPEIVDAFNAGRKAADKKRYIPGMRVD